MSLLFADSFDHYTDITSKWDFGGPDNTILLPNAAARTGLGCLSITTAAFGPTKTFAHIADLLVGIAWSGPVPTPTFTIVFGNNADSGFNAMFLGARVGADGSISAVHVPAAPAVLGTSAAGVVKFQVYNSIAMRATCEQLATVSIWVNGVLVLHLTGVDTRHPNNPALHYSDRFGVMGPSGNNQAFIDDVYAFDCSAGGPNSDFPGNVRVFESVATANGAPLVWAPNAGTNFSNTTEIPPDGDTSFNSSGNVGDADQYVYPAANIPANGTIFAVQHTMDLRIDSGARSVASSVGGALTGPSNALTTGYKLYPTPYDTNPLTGLAWAAGDFPANFGPKVTA